mmetsp:Transcript_14563/g.47814  ORF Transcript_14563/g.47814 Transcript_14563/m.47814 type:complete len:211 (+) Transcript_14563:491-1123(+)
MPGMRVARTGSTTEATCSSVPSLLRVAMTTLREIVRRRMPPTPRPTRLRSPGRISMSVSFGHLMEQQRFGWCVVCEMSIVAPAPNFCTSFMRISSMCESMSSMRSWSCVTDSMSSSATSFICFPSSIRMMVSTREVSNGNPPWLSRNAIISSSAARSPSSSKRSSLNESSTKAPTRSITAVATPTSTSADMIAVRATNGSAVPTKPPASK